MKHQYDIFEEFLDGSLVWRVSVSGRYDTERKIQEFAEQSYNRFHAISVEAGETVRIEG
jgi:hypothetical protein